MIAMKVCVSKVVVAFLIVVTAFRFAAASEVMVKPDQPVELFR